MRHILTAMIMTVMAAALTGCGPAKKSAPEFKQVSTSEASALMESGENYIILDVRTAEEYAQGHIPNAVNVPVETIGEKEIEALPDKEQLILVYCRSGNRSKTASAKLAEKGYTNIVEFGGINSWTGEVVTD